MVFASAVLMLAGSPQTVLGIASAQESLFLVVEILAVYGRHVSDEIARALIQFRVSSQAMLFSSARSGVLSEYGQS
jgi:hypothetical protein